MNGIQATYAQLARPWTEDELARRFDEASRHAEQLSRVEDDRARTPVAMLASAVPALAALNVALHVLHVLPDAGDPGLAEQLLLSAEKSAAIALQRMHRALQLDGVTHSYRADEWLPAVYETAAALLESARLECEPPSLVDAASASVRWLSQAISDLDQDEPDATAAIVDGLGRVLALEVFATVARDAVDT
jgi:hypothetical protein